LGSSCGLRLLIQNVIWLFEDDLSQLGLSVLLLLVDLIFRHFYNEFIFFLLISRSALKVPIRPSLYLKDSLFHLGFYRPVRLGWSRRDGSCWVFLHLCRFLLLFTLFFGRFTPLIVLFKPLLYFVLIDHYNWLLGVFYWHLRVGFRSQICWGIMFFTQRLFESQFFYFLILSADYWKMSFFPMHALYFILNFFIIKFFNILLSMKEHLRLSKFFIFRSRALKDIFTLFHKYMLTAVLLRQWRWIYFYLSGWYLGNEIFIIIIMILYWILDIWSVYIFRDRISFFSFRHLFEDCCFFPHLIKDFCHSTQAIFYSHWFLLHPLSFYLFLLKMQFALLRLYCLVFTSIFLLHFLQGN
jgi:hypothetical protein